MRSPSEYYIKFLISQREHDENVILRILEDFDLEGLTGQYIKDLQRKMEPFPDPWKPGAKDPQSDEYLRKHGIKDLWYPSAAVKEAYTILGSPQLRADVEQLLLAPLRVEEVVDRLNKHHGIKLTVAGVSAFGHYFWNRRLLSMDEWVSFLENRPGAYKKTAVLKVSPDVAKTIVPWLSGMTGPPPGFNSGSVSRRVRDVAFLKVLEIEHQPATLAHSKMMKNYMDVIRGAESEMRQSDVALKDVLRAFEKFRMRKDADQIPSIEQVAGPNYSQSGEGTDHADEVIIEDWDSGGNEDGVDN